ncbi:LOW QUALITY PROTEIN: enoyl-CoA hydratase [Bacillus sp. JCM 19046]|nr:LOW QUALITY PROTEIN: enoyl-CoA hydratase [Bacillus sp. JCM 19046]
MQLFQYIETSIENGVGRIELNRQQQYNALNRAMIKEIATIIEQFDQNDEVAVVLLSGRGKAFSSGADIAEMMDSSTIQLELLNQFADWDRISRVKNQSLVLCMGLYLVVGLNLLLSCDLLLAATTAEFSFPEVSLGVMPGAGGTQRLTKLVGRTKALEWLLTGERISADEALEQRIVNRLIQPELLEEEALRFAQRIAKQPPLSLRLIKDSVNQAVHSSLQEGLLYERKNFYLLFASQDQTEGMRAFMDKREPRFEGR